MSKDKITDWSQTAADNTDIGGIGILGSNAVSNFDGAFRTAMKQVADVDRGTNPVRDTFTFGNTSDLTKRARFNTAAVTAGQTRVITVPDRDLILQPAVEQVEILEIGQSVLTNTAKYIDFHTSTTLIDYNARIVRGAGANGTFQFVQTGTGTFQFSGGAVFIDKQGTEGGEIRLELGTGSTLSGTHVVVDQAANSVRMIESGGSNRGFNLGIDTGVLSHSVSGIFWNATNSASSIGTSGYQKLQSGLIVQWSAYSGTSGDATTAFPITFPNAVFGISVTPNGDPGAAAWTCGAEGATTSAFNIRRRSISGGVVSVGNFPVAWIAWGN